jgi:hypothetical protein
MGHVGDDEHRANSRPQQGVGMFELGDDKNYCIIGGNVIIERDGSALAFVTHNRSETAAESSRRPVSGSVGAMNTAAHWPDGSAALWHDARELAV